MKNFPEELTCSAGIIHNGFIYIFGGSRVKGDTEQALTCAYRLRIDDGLQNAWERLNSLPSPRRGHVLIANGDRIFIVGGSFIEKGTQIKPVRTVDIFDTITGKFESKDLASSSYLDPIQTDIFGNRCIV